MEEHASPNSMTRRTFSGWCIGGLAAVCTILAGVPVLGTLLAPVFQRSKKEQWIEFGTIDTLPVGEPRQLTASLREKDGWYERSVQRAVWVIRKENRECTVFHPRCTHLGCAYRWDGSKQQFTCPCHGGTYDVTGRVTGGPPPRSLDELSAKVENGKLFVRFV